MSQSEIGILERYFGKVFHFPEVHRLLCDTPKNPSKSISSIFMSCFYGSIFRQKAIATNEEEAYKRVLKNEWEALAMIPSNTDYAILGWTLCKRFGMPWPSEPNATGCCVTVSLVILSWGLWIASKYIPATRVNVPVAKPVGSRPRKGKSYNIITGCWY